MRDAADRGIEITLVGSLAKGDFRAHLVRHRYGFDLKPEKIIENLALLLNVFRSFLKAITTLEKTMRESDDSHGASGEMER